MLVTCIVLDVDDDYYDDDDDDDDKMVSMTSRIMTNFKMFSETDAFNSHLTVKCYLSQYKPNSLYLHRRSVMTMKYVYKLHYKVQKMTMRERIHR